MKPSDKQLVDSACRGDTHSFRILFERHYAMAVALAFSRTHDRHLAEDAAQEAFAVACQKLSTLEDGRRFPQWLGTITRRAATTMVQTRGNSSQLYDELVEAKPETVDDYTEIRTAIRELSPTQREVIYLRYFSEMSHEDIAESIGVSTESVHGRLQRARRCLAKQLGKLTSS